MTKIAFISNGLKKERLMLKLQIIIEI